MKLSLVLAVRNEEENLHHALDSTIGWVDEVVIVDGASTDRTVERAKSYGPKVKIFHEKHQTMFHINKQKALEYATGDWILQLDADEEVSPELAKEIEKVINMTTKELEGYQSLLPERKLYLRNEKVILGRSNSDDSRIDSGRAPSSLARMTYSAFYLPRLNYFLGRFLRYGGQYPDGSVRLIKKGLAHFPCRDVHEVMEVEGRTGWLQNPLLHYDSPNFKRYIERNNRYVSMMATEFSEKKLPKNFTNFINFVIYKPIVWFFTTLSFNKGVLDGWQGVVFSFFSALRFPKAYLKYLVSK